MQDQQKHLQQLVEQHNNLIAEINTLSNQIAAKRELSLKVLGAIEYLEQLGVKFPTTEELNTQNQQEIQEEEKKNESTEEKTNPQ